MGPSPTYHPPEGEECETLIEHGLPLCTEPTAGYCSRRPRPSSMWGSRFVGAHAVGPWVGEQKPLVKTPLGGNPGPEMTDLPTYLSRVDSTQMLALIIASFRLSKAVWCTAVRSHSKSALIIAVSGAATAWNLSTNCWWSQQRPIKCRISWTVVGAGRPWMTLILSGCICTPFLSMMYLQRVIHG